METNQLLITIAAIAGSAGLWKFAETRIKLRSQAKKDQVNNSDQVLYRDDLRERVSNLEALLNDSQAKVLELTAEVNQLRVEVSFLKRENDRLKDK